MSDRSGSDRPASDRPRTDRIGSDRPASDRPYRERRDDGPRRDSADRRPARPGDRPDRGSSAGRPYAERTGRSDRASGDRRPDRPSGDRRSDDRRPASGGYRERAGVPESARASFVAEPALSDEFTVAALDPEVRRDLRGLQKDTADSVARHLVAAGTLVEEDPQLALEHARYARRRASRIAVVREAAGITAYHAGEWAEALAELRAARRMGGGPVHLPVMADIERALGRPERAIDIARGPEASELGTAERIELAIVAAGARRDLGELDAAVVGLQGPELEPTRREPWSPRLFYAYADNLLAAGRESDALQWFVHAAEADTEGETDAMGRIAELTGEDPDDADDFAFGVDDGDAAVEASAQVADDPADDEPDIDQVEEAADQAAPGTVAVDGSVDDEPAEDGEPVAVAEEVAVETPVDDVAVDDVRVEDVADLPDEEPAEDAVSEEPVSEEPVSEEAPAEAVAIDEPAEQEPAETESAETESAVEEDQAGTDGGTSR
ncbi:hypothetical protein I4I73_31420 [Pseudonocardia sp. KRD-184]|uniref:TPR-repeat-containing protein n=1 Tax=Pseudonocardia oceani TaxID=2792013 RepID=A0ABS6UHB0_9PSEU|nr:hypothetical protein [Pseudonocardia oceani]MBW0093870.1 hypothetical protein [Pseudonocardia oceani]MBW0100494.1 hypothetical protein [Pseudonocardia oceani]MBW0113092.1 hypothetical protein [Pseudonocardia oceani]MBW0123342.1 hypothetical protein [Pseudonocardia oceani]MBW0131610.1 hypothetical protein [Pseudonocardia oceani]